VLNDTEPYGIVESCSHKIISQNGAVPDHDPVDKHVKIYSPLILNPSLHVNVKVEPYTLSPSILPFKISNVPGHRTIKQTGGSPDHEPSV
jgi:hypothetical protein